MSNILFFHFRKIMLSMLYLIRNKGWFINLLVKFANYLALRIPPKWLIRASGVQLNLASPLREAAMI